MIKTKLIKKILATTLVFVFLFSVTSLALAAGSTNDGAQTGLQNPLKTNDIMVLVTNIMQIVVQIGGIVAVLAIIFVGFSYVQARGKPAKITKSHKSLQYTLIGIFILLGAQIITVIIKDTVLQIAK